MGFGKVAETFHAPLISVEPQLRLSYVVERHRARSRELYPEVEIFSSLDLLLELEVDLVVILTPNETHYPLARQALLAQKHVLLDKPMSLTSVEADDLIALAEEKGKILSVFHNRRWDSDFLTLKKLMESQSLGRLVEVESRFDRFRPQLKGGWREESKPGAGVLYDLGSHLIDQSLQLFGTPQAVFADLRKEREEAQSWDSFHLLFDYRELKVSLHCSCLAAEEPKLRFRARGTKGAWTKHGLDPQEAALQNGQLPEGPQWGREPAEAWGDLSLDKVSKLPSQAGDYPAFYRELAQAIRQGIAPPVLAEQAREVIRMIELCELSHQEGHWIAS